MEWRGIRVELTLKDKNWAALTQLNAIAGLQFLTTFQILPIQVCAISAIEITNFPAQ
jgi:hypothetical protein